MGIETAGDTATLMKRGEICIQTTLSRTYLGLTLNVKVHPRVEEFIRGLGTGTPEDAKRYGRYWSSVDKDKVLTVYDLTQTLGSVPIGGGNYFRLDRIAQPLFESGEGNPNHGSVNLSFLRLVGASEGSGVSFRVNGVHTLDAIRQMRDKIGEAAQSFYINYLKPVNLDVQISTQEFSPR